MQLLTYILVGSLFSFISAQNPNCDFQETVRPGRTYYVYSPGYPSSYPRGIQCRWIAYCPTGFNCRLDCTDINLPNTANCTMDRLLISKTGHPQLSNAERYCGRGSLVAVSTNQAMSVGLIVANNSPGGSFMCRLTAQLATPPPDSCRCGYKKSNRIVGGQETGVNEYPMMAGLVDASEAKIKCGGVIISPRHVLTAAHCVMSQNINNMIVVVGEHDVTIGDSPATQGLLVQQFKIHPQWNPNTYDYDIALVVTRQAMQFSDLVGPACLPFRFTNTDFTGRTVTALGWGTLFPGGPDSSVLMKVDLQVISQASCRASNPLYLSDRQICTYTPGKDACQGDSGGPLLYTDPGTGLLFHVGIVSYGRFCASNSPGINTRVSALLSWVQSAAAPYTFCKK